ncbi:MAG TPA: outer membrane protein transport protein [Gammaproteobacteria bacterium]|nr:outer membrane protein transport protein [Gammaproteobacteria bacterium]
MKPTIRHSLTALAVSATLAAPAAQATNGYFLIGYGAKARGMGGVGIALPQDSVAEATNPAGIAFVGNRADVGLELFNPRRDSGIDATGILGSNTGTVDSGSTLFAVPNGGYIHHLDNKTTLGFSMTGAGGMNTRYNQNVYANAFGPAVPTFWTGLGNSGAPPAFANTGTLGVNLAQAVLAPTVAYKVNDKNAVGASLLVGYQMFRAYGLGLFTGFSSDSAHLTNQGNDTAWGAGVRVGWTGKLNDRVTVGATAASKIYMQKFDKYKGLFAQQGDFDIPANFGVGIAVKADPKTTVAFDITRILYSGVKSIHNPGPTASQFVNGLVSTLTGGTQGNVANPLGTDNGWGFGWQDQTVYKLGVSYEYSDKWTFRGGVNYAKSPIPNDQALFNVLAPGVVQTHGTLGFTYATSPNNELTVAYMHAFRHDQSHTYTTANPLNPSTNLSYKVDFGMDQNALDVSYSWKF